MPYELTPLVAPYVVALLVSAVLWGVLWRHRRRRAAKGFLLDVSGVVLLSAVVALKVAATDPGTKLFWWNWRFLAVPMMAVGYMAMALEYTDRGHLVGRRAWAGLAGVVGLTQVAAWTNGVHGLLYTAGPLQGGLLVPAFGPLYWVYAAVMVACILVGVTVLVDLFRSRRGFNAQVGVLVGTITLVMGGVVLWWLRVVPLDTLALTSTVKVVGFYLAVDRLQLLETMPVARTTVVRNMDDAVFVLSGRGDVVDVNPAAADLVGDRRVTQASIDDVLGVSVAEAVAAGGDEPLESQEMTLEADSETRIYEMDLSRFPDGSGAVAVLRDITERRNRERELTVLNRLVRHDIRNEMNVLHGHGQLLADHLDPAAAEDYRLVMESAEHVIEITDTVRDLMDAITTGGAMDTHAVALAPLLEAEVAKARSSLPTATFEVGSLPAVDVRANELLSSVFANLLNNAVVHNTGEGATVRVDAGVDGDVVRVRVADDGPGVPPGEREAIFGRGEKGLESEGTGVGLYLVDTLTEEYGGGVHVEDAALGGAAFVVELPLAAGRGEAGVAAADERVDAGPFGAADGE